MKPKRCGYCRAEGHDKKTCPTLQHRIDCLTESGEQLAQKEVKRGN